MDTDDGAPQLPAAAFISGNGFDVLGINAYLGRLLTPADDVRGGSAEGWPVVLSYGFWRDNLGGDPSIIGKQIKVSNNIVTVVGVTAPNFRGVWPGSETKLYLPFQFLTVLTGKDEINAPDSLSWCNAIGRLNPGVSVEEARAELATYQKALIDRFIPLQFQDRFQVRNAYLWVSSARTGLPTFFGRVFRRYAPHPSIRFRSYAPSSRRVTPTHDGRLHPTVIVQFGFFGLRFGGRFSVAGDLAATRKGSNRG